MSIGTPLPDDIVKTTLANMQLTNGAIFLYNMKKLFGNDNVEASSHIDRIIGISSGIDVRINTSKHEYFELWFPKSWWDETYKEMNNEER